MSHKILGKGSFGCVVTPKIECKTKKLLNNYDTTKIVEFQENKKTNVENEINISKKLLKLKTDNFDPNDYYCLIQDNCLLDASNIRKNIRNVADECDIDTFKTYNGLHMNNCGVDLYFSKKKKSIFENLDNPDIIRKNIYNLLIGLKKLKDVKILCCDIKPENLMIKNNKIRFLDFGGAIQVSNKTSPNTRIAFTPEFIPFEAATFFLKNSYTFFDSLLENILRITGYNNPKLGFDYSTSYDMLKKLYYDQDFFDNYYKKDIYKFDIYSLGVSLIEIIRNCKKTLNSFFYPNDLLDLLNKMIKPDFRKRLSVEECLDHIYFQPLKESLKPLKKPLQKPLKKPLKKPLQKPIKKRKTRSNKGVPRKKKQPVEAPKTIPKEIKEARRLQNMINKVIKISPKVVKKSPVKKPVKKRKTRSNKGVPRKKKYVIKVVKPEKKRKTRINKGVPRKKQQVLRVVKTVKKRKTRSNKGKPRVKKMLS